MKKLITLILVLMIAAAAAVPALAAGGPQFGGQTAGSGQVTGTLPSGTQAGAGQSGRSTRTASRPFAAAGTITALDTAAQTVTFNVACGNTLVKTSIGQAVTLQTSSATRFLLRNPDGTAIVIGMADLAAGQTISVLGKITDGVWTATRITVGAELTCVP